LDIKVVNNSRQTVIVHQVRLEVARSVEHVQCVPFVHECSVLLGHHYPIQGPVDFAPRWPSRLGEDTEVTLSFRLMHPEGGGFISGEQTWPRYKVYDKMAQDHPFVAALWAAGLRPDNGRYRKLGMDGERTWQMRPIGSRAIMVGTVSYVEADADGMEAMRSHRFRAPVSFAFYRPGDEPTGAYMPPSATYDVLLRAAGLGYSVDVPVSHRLVPGEADRFLVALSAQDCSTHDFRVVLLWNSGSADCGEVRLETWKYDSR
jgi:hypothetical protein